jgi:hypothetical protein
MLDPMSQGKSVSSLFPQLFKHHELTNTSLLKKFFTQATLPALDTPAVLLPGTRVIAHAWYQINRLGRIEARPEQKKLVHVQALNKSTPLTLDQNI